MKKILILAATLLVCTLTKAQDRVDSAPAQLSYKSKEITKALYWEQNQQGKWVSRKNTATPYYGEGKKADNFYNIFIGEYAGHRYLFLDVKDYFWRYPNLEHEWCISRKVVAALLPDEAYEMMQNLKTGKVFEFVPKFYHDMWRSHSEYSFPFFLELTETLRSVSDDDKNYTPILTLKKVETNGKEVVRMRVYPKGFATLIDSVYFELDYSYYSTLFQADKKTAFK